MGSVKIFDTRLNTKTGDITMVCCICGTEFDIEKDSEILWTHYHEKHVEFLTHIFEKN
jgi:hypothetical protein